MAGFIRRFPNFPGVDVLTQIEGVNVLDLPPPGSVSGVGTGTVALVGEFADMTYGTSVNQTTGAVSSRYRPVEAFSAQDLFDKVGGWDETLGDFGGEDGNGLFALRNKKFSRLIVVPINLASPLGVRVFRKLPLNTSATDTNPIVPLQAAIVAAGREFKSGSNRARLAARVVFKDTAAYHSGTDGSWATAGSAAEQAFTCASGDFVNKGVKKGHIVVVGTGSPGTLVDTFRVKTVTSATVLSLEKLDGGNYASSTASSQPWRIHVPEVADSGGENSITDAAGYVVPARPLDATIAADTTISPTVVPPAETATTWDSLSGLRFRTAAGTGLVYDSTKQAVNLTGTGLNTEYQNALAALISEELPARDVNIVWCARSNTGIRGFLKTHVLDASKVSLGRMAMLSPGLTTVSVSTVIGDADPGVGANRDERVVFGWPGVQTFVPEAVGTKYKLADGKTNAEGLLDQRLDGWIASVLSNLAPERNPGEATPTTAGVFSAVTAFQSGMTTTLGMNEYIRFRDRGICALRNDRTVGFILQSGITTSLGLKNINRRRMADFIEDSLARRYVQLVKLPLTNALKDILLSETAAFLEELKSPNNPVAQRIVDYTVDGKSGNTPELEAKGVYIIIVKVRTLATADFITLQAEIGEGVKITTA
jgi:hypothetical protein